MMKKIDFYITILCGSLPLLLRIFVSLLSEIPISLSSVLESVDFIFLGLTLNLINLKELINWDLSKNSDYSKFFINKCLYLYWSSGMIILLSIALSIDYCVDMKILGIGHLRPHIILYSSIVLSLFSLLCGNLTINALLKYSKDGVR